MSLLTGLKAHTWQRISAFYLFWYFPFAVAYLWMGDYSDYEALRKTVLAAGFLIPTGVALGLFWVHAWIGLRDVLLDYFPRKYLVWMLVIVALLLFLSMADMVWVLRSLTL